MGSPTVWVIFLWFLGADTLNGRTVARGTNGAVVREFHKCFSTLLMTSQPNTNFKKMFDVLKTVLVDSKNMNAGQKISNIRVS